MNFTHVPAADTNCTTRNNSVLFSVKPTNTSQYIARAFFPSTADRGRNILVNAVSISHYPQCNGGSSDLEFSSKDANGVRRSTAAERRLALSSTATALPRSAGGPLLSRVLGFTGWTCRPETTSPKQPGGSIGWSGGPRWSSSTVSP